MYTCNAYLLSYCLRLTSTEMLSWKGMDIRDALRQMLLLHLRSATVISRRNDTEDFQCSDFPIGIVMPVKYS